MENPIKMDDLGVPRFLETPIWDKVLLGQTAQDFFQRSSHSKPLTFSHGKTFEKQLRQVFPGVYLVY